MKAKLVNEAIKHLSPRSKDEIIDLRNQRYQDRANIYLEKGIYDAALETGYKARNTWKNMFQIVGIKSIKFHDDLEMLFSAVKDFEYMDEFGEISEERKDELYDELAHYAAEVEDQMTEEAVKNLQKMGKGEVWW